MPKTLSIDEFKTAKEKIDDVECRGPASPDRWQLVGKAFSVEEDWMKSTKCLEVIGLGCLIQVSTQQGGRVAEALAWIPGATYEQIVSK